MRHRRKGRTLGRSPSHRKAMLRNMASSLILTERDAELDDNAPKVKGRIVTTIQKAKEVRPLVEKCVTIARKSLRAEEAAAEFATDADRGTDAYKSWRTSDQWQKWVNAVSPSVAGRRRCLQLLGDKQAVSVLFDEIAPRMMDRDGGYTRILKLATVRLGDAGAQAILEFVGKNDRVKVKSVKPSFDDEPEVEDEPPAEAAQADEEVTAESPAEEVAESGDAAEAADDAAEA